MYKIKRTELNFNVSKAAQGKGGKKTKKTTYIGVHYEAKNPHPWFSIIKHDRKNNYLGSYVKEEYAALAYDKKALEIYGPDAIVNFPGLSIEKLGKKLEKIKKEDAIIFYDHMSRRHQGKLQKVSKTSRYVGVCLGTKKNKPWRSNLFYHNKQIHLGYYATEEEAALAYDKMALKIYGEKARLNLPKQISKNKKK